MIKSRSFKSNLKGISLLLLLLSIFVFSSCTVRNSLQAYFGTTITKVHNVAKSGFNAVNSCPTITSVHAEKNVAPVNNLLLQTNETAFLIHFSAAEQVVDFQLPAKLPFVKSLPIYLLYGKMKLINIFLF